MAKLMRCLFCGLLQDEPAGVKTCARCGGGMDFEGTQPGGRGPAYLQVQMELDQVAAPAGQNVERFLLVTIRTPGQVPPGEEAPAGKQRPLLNFAAALDTSGSMQGEKLTQAREAVRQAARMLHPGDVFSLATFSDEVECPFAPVDVDESTAAAVENALQQIAAHGMTALYAGLELSIQNALKSKKDSNLVLLLSDGQANVGETDLEKVGLQALQARQQGLMVSALGVGNDYNEALMSEIATQGGGRFYHIQHANKIPAFVAGELGEVANLAAREARIVLNIPDGATLVPLSAAFPVTQTGGQAVVSVGDIPCDTELEIPLRLALLSQKAGAKLSVEGNLEFQSPAGHEIKLPVNRVTVRFMEQVAFQIREGLVLPVAEKVFMQLKAVSVLGVSRARSAQPAQAEQKARESLTSLRDYAEKLGEDRAEKELSSIREDYANFAASPMAAKQAVFNANRTQRGSKDFDKK
jgi:Ca-activated chloride channel family protein